jgi:hypothetical protein
MRYLNLFLFCSLLVPINTTFSAVHTLVAKGNGDERNYSDPVTIKEGEYFQVLWSQGDQTFEVQKDGEVFDLWVLDSPVIAGPCTVRTSNRGPYAALVTISIKRSGSGSESIIPPDDDPEASYEVFMEASTDLEKWARMIPGTYSASGPARFFRVSMIRK